MSKHIKLSLLPLTLLMLAPISMSLFPSNAGLHRLWLRILGVMRMGN